MSSHIIKYSAKILNQKDHRHQKLCSYVIFLSNFMAFLSTFWRLSAITFDPEGVTNKQKTLDLCILGVEEASDKFW